MQISVGEKNLESLFSGRHHVIVPGFQRNYSWTLDQVTEYWTDLKSSAQKSEPHFWGPIVLLQEGGSQDELKLIDGQQRITTAMISLSLLRDAAHKLTNKVVREGLPGTQDVHNTIRNFLFRPPAFTDPKFTASYLINEVFKSHIVADPISIDGRARPELSVRGKGLSSTERVATRELRRSYLRLQDLMTKFLNEVPEENSKRAERILALFTALTSGFEIHSMVLNSEDDAYILFETLNDRGLQLNPSDLLKTLTLRHIKNSKSPEDFEGALSVWDKMVQNLGEYDFSKFLRHYLLTQTEKPVQAKKIFTFFKDQIESQGIDGAEKNLHRLFTASETYAKLLGITDLEDDALSKAVLRMNSFSDTHRVFLLATLQSGLPIEMQRTLFRGTEYLAARWILAGENAQELESLYQNLAHQISKAPTSETANKVVLEMLAKAPSDGDLSLLYRTEKADMQRYFLRRIEETSGGLTLTWDKPITIEHLAPQKPSNDSNWAVKIYRLPDENEEDFSYDEVIQQWGNLTLLEKKLNSSIQNSEWLKKVNGDNSTKYDGLNASTMNINKSLVLLKDWDRASIDIRNAWVTNASLQLVSKEWVLSGTEEVEKLTF